MTQPAPKPASRQLPPLSPRTEIPEGTEPPPPRKKKKRAAAAMGEANGEGVTPRRRPTSANPPPTTDTDPASGADTPKKKKKKKAVTASQEQLVGSEPNGTVANGNTPRKKKKKKRKKKSAVGSETEEEEGDIGLGAELYDLHDDVISKETENTGDVAWATPAMRSAPINKVFIERRSGFKSTDKAKISAKRTEEQLRAQVVPTPELTSTTLQFAINTQHVFMIIARFFQGLFAGISMWNLVITWYLSSISWNLFLYLYGPIAWPMQGIFFLLYAISCVAAFDRYDVSRPDRQCVVKAFTIQSGAICCFFYFSGLIFSLSVAAIDDKITLYQNDTAAWGDNMQYELYTWRVLNTIRGIMPILGWLVIAISPTTDRLSKNLEKADENIMGEQMPEDNNVHWRSSGV